MTPIIFLFVFAVGVVMTFVRPIWGIYIYSVMFYFSPHRTWWDDLVPDIRYLQIVAIAGVLSSIMHGYWNSERFRQIGPEFKIFAAFVGFMWLASLWAITGELHADGRALFTKHLLICFLMVLVIENYEQVRNVLLVHVAGGLWLGYQAFGRSGGRLEGIAGALGDANTLGMHMSCLAILAGFMFLASRKHYRWISFLSLPLVINTVVLTSSRGATVGLFAGGVVAGILCPKKLRPHFAIAGVLGLVMMFMLADDKLLERIESVFVLQGGNTEEINATSGSRVDIALAGYEMWKDHPIGTGYKGTNWLSPEYMGENLLTRGGRRSAHNSLFAILVDFGLIGLGLYLFMYMRMFLNIRSMNKQIKKEDIEGGALLAGVGGALAVVFVSGQASNYYHAEIQYWLLAIITVMYRLHMKPQDAPAELNRQTASPTRHAHARNQ